MQALATHLPTIERLRRGRLRHRRRWRLTGQRFTNRRRRVRCHRLAEGALDRELRQPRQAPRIEKLPWVATATISRVFPGSPRRAHHRARAVVALAARRSRVSWSMITGRTLSAVRQKEHQRQAAAPRRRGRPCRGRGALRPSSALSRAAERVEMAERVGEPPLDAAPEGQRHPAPAGRSRGRRPCELIIAPRAAPSCSLPGIASSTCAPAAASPSAPRRRLSAPASVGAAEHSFSFCVCVRSSHVRQRVGGSAKGRGIVGLLDIGTSKIVCLIAALRPVPGGRAADPAACASRRRSPAVARLEGRRHHRP